MVTETLLAKFLGAFAGAILALVFLPPKTIRGFVKRGFFSLTSGVIFAGASLEKLTWTETTDHWIAASAGTAFISWWAAGLVISLSRKWFEAKTSE